MARTQQKAQTGQALSSREQQVYQREKLGQKVQQGTQPESTTYQQESSVATQNQAAVLSEYKAKHPDYIVEQRNGSIILKAPLKRIDPNYGDKYSEKVYTFNEQGQLTGEQTYITQTYQGSAHAYMIDEKSTNPSTGITTQKKYDIEGYGTKLRVEQQLSATGELIKTDEWQREGRQAAQDTTKYYYNPLTKSYSTQKIEGQEGVSKEQASQLTKTYIEQGKSPIQYKFAPQTAKGGGYETVSLRAGEKLYLQQQKQQAVTQPTPSTYKEPSRKVQAQAPTTGLKAEGLETERATEPKTIKEKAVGFFVHKENGVTKIGASRESIINVVQSGLDKVTRKAFGLTPITKKSLESYEKSFGEGHGTLKEQTQAIPYGITSTVTQTPTTILKGWSGLQSFQDTKEKPLKIIKEKGTKIAGEQIEAFSKAPVTYAGTAITTAVLLKGVSVLKSKPSAISKKATVAIKEFDIEGEYPSVTQEQFVVPKAVKATEYREQVQKFKGKEVKGKEKATDYAIDTFEPTVFTQVSKKGEKIGFFSVEVGGTTYQTLSKPPYTLITKIKPTGKAKTRIIETKIKNELTPFKKIEGEDIVLGKFKTKIEPFVKTTETIKRFDVKNVEKEGVPLDKYYKFEEQYTGEELLARKIKKRPRVLKDASQRLTAPVPKEITRQKQVTIFETGYAKVGKGTTPVTGKFIEKLESDLVTKTQKPAATVALGKPVVYPEIGAKVPEFMFKKVEPTEYEFKPFKVYKEPSTVIGIETGETYITKEAVARSSQRYKYKGKGYLSFKEQPLPTKIKVPTPVVRESKPFEWLKEEKKPEAPISPLGDLSRLEAEQRVYGIKRRQGQDIMEQFAGERTQRQQVQEIQIMQPKLARPEKYFGYPLEDLKGVLRTETRGTSLSSALVLQNRQMQRQLSRQTQVQNQIQKQSQLQNQVQKQMNMQSQIQRQQSIQQQKQIQSQVQTQIQRQTSIQQQRQMQRQSQTQITPQITLERQRITPETIRIPFEKPKQRQGGGYIAEVKKAQYKVGKKKYIPKGYVAVNKEPLTREAALALAATNADRYTNQSFRIRQVSKPAVQNTALEERWQTLKTKFRPQKRNPNIYVEKNKYAIDSMEEIQGIPYEGQKVRRQEAKRRRFF